MRTLRSAVLAACAALVLAPAVAGAQPATDAAFYSGPAAGSSTDPAGGFFLLEATPGQELDQRVALRNDADRPLELRLDAVDAGTAQMGGSSFALETDEPAGAATWITLDRTSVALAPGESAFVGVRVTVPADAVSGVHLAGISVLVPGSANGSAAAAGGAGASVFVQSRRVIAVQVNLPGPADPELVITGVAPVARPDGLYLTLALANTGRGLTNGEGVLTLPGDGFERRFSIGTFIPGTSISYPLKWTGEAGDGDHPARVEIRYGDRTASWDGTFTVGEEVRDEQANRQVQPPTQEPSGSGPPITLIAGSVAGALLLLAGGVALGRRSSRPRG